MPATLILLPGALALAALLYFEKREDRRGMVPVKSALSCLFIVAVLTGSLRPPCGSSDQDGIQRRTLSPPFPGLRSKNLGESIRYAH